MPTLLDKVGQFGGEVKTALFQSEVRNRRAPFLTTRSTGAYGVVTSGNVGFMPNGLVNTGFATTSGELDFDKLINEPLNNSIVAACVNAIVQALPSAPIILEKRKSETEFDRVPKHSVLDLLHNPNPWLSEAELWGATTAWERTRGEAYWYFEYGSSRTTPKEIWLRAPQFVQIESTPDAFISQYIITSESGAQVPFEDKDVVHFRHQLNLNDLRHGWHNITTGKRQIAGDEGASTYHAAILRNAGAASIIISLKDSAAADTVTPGQLQEYVEQFKRKVSGAGAGAILGLDLPLDVHKVGFSPEEMVLDKLLEQYVERICALMGVNRRVINLGNDPTYENYAEALDDFWKRCIVPMRDRHASTLTSQLLPLFGLAPSEYRLRFDYSGVPSLQEDVDKLVARWVSVFKEGGVDLFVFQEKIGLKPEDDYKGKFVKPTQELGAEDTSNMDNQNPTQNEEKKALPAVDISKPQKLEPWTDAELDEMTTFTEADLKDMLARATPEARALLTAKPENA